MILLAEASIDEVKAQEKPSVAGTVLDENGNPLSGANVTILTYHWRRFVKRVKTDSAGRFHTSVDKEGSYLIYVTYDDRRTPGMDYVPERWRTWLSSNSISSRRFILGKGASIYLDGQIRYIETNKVAYSYRFTVLGTKGGESYWTGPIKEYGSYSDLFEHLGFDERLVVVPADTEVKIQVKAYFPQKYSQTFILAGKTGYFKLSQGEVLHIDVREHNILSNTEYVKEILSSGFSLLYDCLTAGFLVEIEKESLLDAYNLVKESSILLREGFLDQSFAKLRSAYIIATGTKSTLEGLIESSSNSLLPLLFLFLFIAFASASLMAEGSARLEIAVNNRKLLIPITSLAGAILYIFLVTLFYLVFPGCHLIPQSTYIVMSAFTFIIGKIVSLLFIRFSRKEERGKSIQFKSAIAAAFLMGSRNLRRRRMRTLMNIFSVIMLVFGFITLTSISPGYGLWKRELRPTIPVDALLIKDEPLGGEPGSFVSIPESFMEWIKSYPNITLISPKAENSPVTLGSSLGRLYSESGESTNVLGIIGIIPSKEAKITGINRVVTNGSYLEDDDLEGIIVSSSLHESLNVYVGDNLYGFGRKFVIRGFFDDDAMKKLVDINGLSFLPYYIVKGDFIPCPVTHAIIVNYEVALTLPQVSISRVAVQLDNEENYESLAEIVALTYEYNTYVSHPGSLTLHSLGSYIEAQGVELVFPLMILVILNIGMSMFAAVNERRNEIAALSSLGLNPTHIATLFVAEALIIGFIGGGFGYLFGISGYRIAALLGGFQVREKVSADWGIISILLSGFTAAIASLIPALRSSVIVTPSLLRKWRIEDESIIRADKPQVLHLPLRLTAKELEPFIAFVTKRLRAREVKIKEEPSKGGVIRKISFAYDLPEIGWTENEIIIQPEVEGYSLKMMCSSHGLSSHPVEAIRKTASHVRNVLLEWSAMTCEIATSFDPYLSKLYNLVNVYNPTTLYLISPYPDVHKKIDEFKEELILRGIRPPKFFVANVDTTDLEQTIKTVKEMVSRANVVCVSGEDATLCSALAMEAVKQNKTVCYVIDDRPIEERIRDPFKDLEIISSLT
ncbi:FtsX-like permease family protein [Candidatus Bathyarchaeota archaeon]|nr:MAG: FtsX-like permease family protein [Candidatus Bathyarchaeota archaeon]